MDVQRFVVVAAEQIIFRVREQLGIIMIAFRWLETTLLTLDEALHATE